MSDLDRFLSLLRAKHPCVSIVTHEEEDARQLVVSAAAEARLPCWLWSINAGLRDGLIAHSAPVPDTEHPAAAMYHLCTQSRASITMMLDLGGHLKDERTLRQLRELIDACDRNMAHLALIDHQDQFPAVIQSLATPFELSLPDEQELTEIVKSVVRELSVQAPLRVELTRAGVQALIRNLRGLTRRQVRQVILDVVVQDQRLDMTDIRRVLSEKRRALQGEGLLEFVEAPVDLSEIGGLARLKRWLAQRQDALGPEATAYGLPAPRGVLMLGVQGAGKSLAAKAVASAWQYPLMRMDVGALYDKYIGESERRLRDTLRQAESMAPIILWIDEIEKAFASAASRSTDGGLSQRMFGTLLTWMQEHHAPVFTIATANDIEALPPELLRKGRFDEIFFVDLPDAAARRQIVAIHLRKRGRDPAGFDIAALAAAADGYSGAEIEQAVISGLHNAFAAKQDLATEHVLEALRTSPPLSVTMAERLQALKAWAKGRCVPAD